MPHIFTLSAYETSAHDFFTKLLEEKTDLVLDIRLKNTNQLCGFTKRQDLEYLVTTLTGAKYVHDLRLAPSEALLERYIKHWCNWEEYAKDYKQQMQQENVRKLFKTSYGRYRSICLLGTATKKRRSHSEALQELLAKK